VLGYFRPHGRDSQRKLLLRFFVNSARLFSAHSAIQALRAGFLNHLSGRAPRKGRGVRGEDSGSGAQSEFFPDFFGWFPQAGSGIIVRAPHLHQFSITI
jgi:hypothetical protein